MPVTNEDIMNELRDMRKGQEKQSVRLARVERTLIGDKEFEVEGLVTKVNKHEKKHEEIDGFKKKAAGAFAVLTIVWAAIMWGIKELLNQNE